VGPWSGASFKGEPLRLTQGRLLPLLSKEEGRRPTSGISPLVATQQHSTDENALGGKDGQAMTGRLWPSF